MEADRIVGAINARCAGMASLSTLKPAQPHLVPVRLGGPHAHFVAKDGWSLWRDGQHNQWQQYGDGSLAPAFRITDGCWQWWSPSWKRWEPRKSCDRVRDRDELRAPKDWTGDLPEGTRLATDVIVRQRVRVVPADSFSRSDGKVTKVIETGDGQRVTVHWPEDDYTCDYGPGAAWNTKLEGY